MKRLLFYIPNIQHYRILPWIENKYVVLVETLTLTLNLSFAIQCSSYFYLRTHEDIALGAISSSLSKYTPKEFIKELSTLDMKYNQHTGQYLIVPMYKLN